MLFCLRVHHHPYGLHFARDRASLIVHDSEQQALPLDPLSPQLPQPLPSQSAPLVHIDTDPNIDADDDVDFQVDARPGSRHRLCKDALAEVRDTYAPKMCPGLTLVDVQRHPRSFHLSAVLLF